MFAEVGDFAYCGENGCELNFDVVAHFKIDGVAAGELEGGAAVSCGVVVGGEAVFLFFAVDEGYFFMNDLFDAMAPGEYVIQEQEHEESHSGFVEPEQFWEVLFHQLALGGPCLGCVGKRSLAAVTGVTMCFLRGIDEFLQLWHEPHVIGFALKFVTEDIIGDGDFFKSRFGIGIWIFVRMIFHGKLAISLLDFLRACSLADS